MSQGRDEKAVNYWLTWKTDAERELLAQLCRRSFWAFFKYCYVGSNPKLKLWLTERIHKPLCDWLELHGREWVERRARTTQSTEKEITNLLVILPRNFGKTTIVTQAWTLWLHLQDPDLSVFIGSENLAMACEWYKPLRTILAGGDEYPRFTEFYGNWTSKALWSSEALVTAARKSQARKDPSIGTWGVESGLTGSHPDVLILDDPTSYEKMVSIGNWLNYVNDHVDSLTPVLNPDGMMVFVGTRYSDGDHLGRAITEQGVRSASGMEPPGGVEVRPDGKWHLFFMAARDAAGKPVFPEVWSEKRLKDYERDKNSYYWAQVMNDPSSVEFNPLTRAQTEECWVEPKDVPSNLRYTIHCDTAFKRPSRQGHGDESVIQVWGHTRDGSGEVYYLEGYGSKSWRMEDFLGQLTSICHRYELKMKRIWAMTDESEQGGHDGSYELALAAAFNGSPCKHQPRLFVQKRGDTRKKSRIIQAASYWAESYVKLVRGAPGVERLVDQMTRIHTTKHDDWSDPAADVFCADIYQPLRRTGRDEQPPRPTSPTDATLKGVLTNDAATALYDRYFDRQQARYEPV